MSCWVGSGACSLCEGGSSLQGLGVSAQGSTKPGQLGLPGGAQATAGSQRWFCKLRCSLCNLFTGAQGGACGAQRAERICPACCLPCPAKGLQAGACAPSCWVPGLGRHGMPDMCWKGPRLSPPCGQPGPHLGVEGSLGPSATTNHAALCRAHRGECAVPGDTGAGQGLSSCPLPLGTHLLLAPAGTTARTWCSSTTRRGAGW